MPKRMPILRNNVDDKETAQCSETSSVIVTNQASAEKRRKRIMRSLRKTTTSSVFDDFVAYATGLRILDRCGKPTLGTDVKLPRNSRGARRSKFGYLWSESQ